ncbi:MAG: site-specific integrase, partial [Proteobacteria bacterium]|nr:site-specific integrase [Pseudomonadota bacterium]
PTKKAAEIAEAEAIAEYLRSGRLPIDPPEIPTDSCPTVLELLNDRVTWVELHRSLRYAQDHRWVFRQVLARVPEWAELPVTSITVNMVEAWAEEWAADLLDQGLTRNEINKALTLLQAAWNRPWGTKRQERDFPENPFARVERYSVERGAKFLPTDAQVAAMLVAAGPKHRDLFEVYAGTGARPREGLVVQWVDIQAEAEPYFLDLYTRKKRGGVRTPRRVPISPELAGRLRSRRRRHPNTHFVFEWIDAPVPPRALSYDWAHDAQVKACAAAAVPYFTLHCWRHYYASKLYRDGVDRARIQALLGHENASTTDKYLHELIGLPAGSG